MKIQRHWLPRLCFALAAGLVMTACTKKETPLRDLDVSGTYALVSVNGNPVPAEITHEGAAIQVRRGSFTLRADGTCSSETVFVPPSGTEVTREVSATYTQADSRLTMQWEGAGQTVGTIEGTTFTMENEDMVLMYRK